MKDYVITVYSTDEPKEALFDKCIGGKVAVGEGKKPAGHRDDGDAAQVQATAGSWWRAVHFNQI